MNLGALVSETRNPQTMDLDALSTGYWMRLNAHRLSAYHTIWWLD